MLIFIIENGQTGKRTFYGTWFLFGFMPNGIGRLRMRIPFRLEFRKEWYGSVQGRTI
jgi:hypothetical protein